MSLDLFPIMAPDPAGGVQMKMLYVFSYGGESHVSCMRDVNEEEHDWLCANWPEYLRQRAEWLAWARVHLRPPFQPGSGWAVKYTQASVDRLLDFQT